MRYTVTLTPDDNGTLLVSVPDLPEALTFGDSRDEALLHAVDAIETALIAAMDAREEIPEPRVTGPEWVALPALTVAKLALYRAMRADGVGKAALARRLGVSLPHIDRLLDLRHQSRLDAVERALAALDRIMTITIAAA
ncbi:MAG: type II toxin-antitoxin system HicB family antitoxin [Hyphomicrobiales bacterium]